MVNLMINSLIERDPIWYLEKGYALLLQNIPNEYQVLLSLSFNITQNNLHSGWVYGSNSNLFWNQLESYWALILLDCSWIEGELWSKSIFCVRQDCSVGHFRLLYTNKIPIPILACFISAIKNQYQFLSLKIPIKYQYELCSFAEQFPAVPIIIEY